MKLLKHIHKLAIAIIFVMLVQVLYASNTFSGGKDNKKEVNKYSLKDLSKYSNKPLTLNIAKYTFKLNSTSLENGFLNNKSTSSIQFTKGNTTFIYPYKMKVKVPKFKTPTPNKF
ncbi:MAG: hypothetical protein KF781_04985 [Chitinophagaceae bacterium]|nr:hypothetical protein [Chitinophagaceae bacterium]MCW5905874.1 hypothetical protein [Chitinophagaceae bacterium]